MQTRSREENTHHPLQNKPDDDVVNDDINFSVLSVPR